MSAWAPKEKLAGKSWQE